MNELIARFEYLLKRNPIKAIHLLKEALIAEPQNYDYLLALGLHLAKIGDDYSAIKYLEKANNVSALDESSRFTLAISYMRIEDFSLAIKNFRLVENDIPEAIYNIAVCYIKMGDLRKSVDEAKKLKDNNKMLKSSLKLIIDVYLYINELNENSSELLEYKEKFGEDAFYHLTTASIYYNKQCYIQSAYHYSKIPYNAMDRSIFLRNMAISFRQIEQFSKALECFKELEDSEVSPNLFAYLYAETLYITANYEEVLRVADKYSQSISMKSELQTLKSRAYYKLNLQ